MFRRLTWATAGALAGFGASKWLERMAKKRIRRYLPSGLSGLGGMLRVAAKEGRRAMELREGQLRERFSLGADSGGARPVDVGETTPRTRSRSLPAARRSLQTRPQARGRRTVR